MDFAQSRVPLTVRCLRVLAVAVVLWASRPASAACVLDTIEVSPRSDEVAICFSLSKGEAPQCQALALVDPPRLVIDLNDAALTSPKYEPVAVKVAGIERVRIAQFESDPAVVRVVLDLNVAADSIKWMAGSPPGGFCLRVGPNVGASLSLPQVTAQGKGALVRLTGAGLNKYTVGTLQNPPRVYVDVLGMDTEMSARQACSVGPLREIRMARHEAEPEQTFTRIAAELNRVCSYAVYRDGADLVLAVDVPPPAGATIIEPHRPNGSLKGLKIVVDPGHGGHDVGAPADFGPPARGPFEKDVVLDISLRLTRVLLAEGAQVRMTRSDDRYVALRARSDMANSWRADAFISVHCNSCKVPNSARGTSVYYDHDHSIQFARLVQKELVAALETKDNDIRAANFSVIRRATMPGILVETAFINHQVDRVRLMKPAFRQQVAHAIVQGLKQFISQYPRDSRTRSR